MAFLVPEYVGGAFHTGGDQPVPYWVMSDVAYIATHCRCNDDDYELVRAWWARLSAPGYLDCTEWAGPFDSLAQAKAYIRDTYDVDPETGDDLDTEVVDVEDE